MSNSIAIQAIDLNGLASNHQTMFQSLLSATSANSTSPLDSTSDIVQLSLRGQVLAAGATLDNTIIMTDVTPVVVSATPVAANTPATPDVAATEIPAAIATTTTSANQSPLQQPAAATVDRLSADLAAADATHALQVLMADSALRDVIFNPAYSALIASSHLSDFIVPMARTRTGAIPAEIPGAVLPISRIGAISSYQDAASSFVGR